MAKNGERHSPAQNGDNVCCISGDHQLLSAKQISQIFGVPNLQGGGALWASGDATWGVQHSINKEKNQGTFDSFSTLVVNKMLPFAGGISDWPFRSSLGITLMQIGARLAGDPQERKSICPSKEAIKEVPTVSSEDFWTNPTVWREKFGEFT